MFEYDVAFFQFQGYAFEDNYHGQIDKSKDAEVPRALYDKEVFSTAKGKVGHMVVHFAGPSLLKVSLYYKLNNTTIKCATFKIFVFLQQILQSLDRHNNINRLDCQF